MVYMKATETIEMMIHGAHQLALRRKSANVLDGAMNVFMMRAPSESGGASGIGAEEVGRTGAADMNTSFNNRDRHRILVSPPRPGKGPA